MQRISTTSAWPTLVTGTPGTPGYFVGEDVSAGRPPTALSPDWLNAVQEELGGAVEAFGVTLDPTDNNQLAKVLQKIYRKVDVPLFPMWPQQTLMNVTSGMSRWAVSYTHLTLPTKA